MNLYKYCGLNYLIENITNNQIRLGRVLDVNDPYEGLHRFSVSENIRSDFYKKFYENNYDEDSFKSYQQQVLENQVVDMNHKTFLNEIGISSFSEINNSLTMWGHYADKHKGVCLEFNSNKSIFKEANKVQYSNLIYTIPINSTIDLEENQLIEHGLNMCYFKALDWSYEKEWRIIGKSNSFVNYDQDALTGLFFGFKTPVENILEIFKHTQHIRGLKYYRPVLSRSSYSIKFLPATIDELNR